MHLVDASGAVSTSIEGVHPGAEWSPDGTRLAYVSQSSGSGRIVVADADGSNAREVRQDDMPQGWHWPLVWVSSNEIAVHHRARAASSYTLWIVPVDGGPRRLVVDPADLNFPLAMQPHGSLLVYSVTTSNGVVRALLDVRTGRGGHSRSRRPWSGHRTAACWPRRGRTGSSCCGRTGQAGERSTRGFPPPSSPGHPTAPGSPSRAGARSPSTAAAVGRRRATTSTRSQSTAATSGGSRA